MALSRREILEGSAGLALSGAAALNLASPALAQAPRRSAAETVDVAELMKPGPLGDCVLGKEDAPVTIVEYASLTCGHCANFHNTILPGLKEKFIDTGKVKLVFREFPLNQLDTAVYMLSRCALGADGKSSGDQARYFAMVGVFFKDQRQWAFTNDPLAAVTNITREVLMPGMRVIDGEYGLPPLPEVEFVLIASTGSKTVCACELGRLIVEGAEAPAPLLARAS